MSIVPAKTLPVVQRGPYTLSASYLEVNPAKVAGVERAIVGARDGDKPIFLEEILQDAGQAFHVTITQADLTKAGMISNLNAEVPVYALLLFPTVARNAPDDYAFPFNKVVLPHMLLAGDTPRFPRVPKRFPVIVFSHGYAVHPLWDIADMITLASHGYVVVNIIHGDGRFGDISDDENLRLMGDLRIVGIRKMLRALRDDHNFGVHCDFTNVGVVGYSFGGWCALEMLKHPLVGAVDAAGEVPIKAAFGGSPALDLYGQPDDATLRHITAPFFALVGGKDSRLQDVQYIMPRFGGPHTAVEAPDQSHVFSDTGKHEVFATWAVAFFTAYLTSDPAALRRFTVATAVDSAVANSVLPAKCLNIT
jgi:dienelactone hydrolase